MRLTILALAVSSIAVARPALADGRLADARRIIAASGVDLEGVTLEHNEAVATAVLLLRRPERPVLRHARRSGEPARLLFRVVMEDGRVEQVALVDDSTGDLALALRVAKRLERARAGRDIDAEVFVPVVAQAPK